MAALHMSQEKMGVVYMAGWEVSVIAFLLTAVMGDQTQCVCVEMITLGRKHIAQIYVCLA